MTYLNKNIKTLGSNVTIPGGNTIANTTTETAFASTITIYPDQWILGDIFLLKTNGVFSSGITPGIRGRIKIGSVVIGDTTTISSVVANATNLQWRGYLDITVLTLGSSGTIEVQGALFFSTGVGIGEIPMQIINTSTITIDMTVNQTLSLTSQWSAALAGNSLTLRQIILCG